MSANELTKPVRLSMKNSLLNKDAIGWARKPLVHSNIRGNFLRKKKWNYWCVTSPEVLFFSNHFTY